MLNIWKTGLFQVCSDLGKHQLELPNHSSPSRDATTRGQPEMAQATLRLDWSVLVWAAEARSDQQKRRFKKVVSGVKHIIPACNPRVWEAEEEYHTSQANLATKWYLVSKIKTTSKYPVSALNCTEFFAVRSLNNCCDHTHCWLV